MKITLGQRIRKLRESKDYSQENVAAELNLTTSAYSKIERGVTDPSAQRLMQIAEVLEVDVSSLFQDTPRLAADPRKEYGFATKGDIEELVLMINAMRAEIDKLKKAGAQKVPLRKRKK